MDKMSRFVERGTAGDELFVVLHGFASSGNRMQGVRGVIRSAHPNADLFAPALPYQRNWLCLASAERIVADCLDAIDGLVAQREASGGHYRTIVFVGHSFGAVLARRIAITAFGERRGKNGERPAPFASELQRFRTPRPWARSIRRLVLLAGMNRGWTVSSALDWITSAQWTVWQLVAEILFRGKPTILAIRRGAPFLVQTRIEWLTLMDAHYGARPDLTVVQLLGTQDDRVSPDDNVDYAIDLFGNTSEQSYFHLEVHNSGHANVIDMAPEGPAATVSARVERRAKFLTALDADRDHLTACCISRAQMADSLPPEPDDRTTDVVFVIHGIRDKGFWTQKIARTIKQHAGAEQRFESWTESYGYFAMLPFLFRSVRQRKVEWLMDRYAEARARYPRARFHYVGHSNGTYLAAQALRDYPAARFERIVFAGSVVRRDYDWLALIAPPHQPTLPRVGTVLNYVATGDWVVALFPKALQPWRSFNLGSAGHDGFMQGSASGPVYQVTYIVGGHGAGHDESHWDEIARFITSGTPPPRSFPPLSERRDLIWRLAGGASYALFPVFATLVLIIAVALFWSAFAALPCDALRLLRAAAGSLCEKPTGSGAAWRSFAFIGYAALLYTVITRF